MPLGDKLQFLGRMKSDCEYYLGQGRKQTSHLWRKSVDGHISYMQELLSSNLREDRPDWLTFEDIRHFSDRMDHRPVIKAETLGLSGARFISFGQENRDEPRSRDEVFFTIKKRVYAECDSRKKFGFARSEHGYIRMSCGMEKIFMTLFRDRLDNRSMECIEWEDSWNIVFKDGIYISSRSCRMEKPEFAEWYRSIRPAEAN